MFLGNLQIKEAARKLGIDQDTLKERLEMMEHMGYIRGLSSASAASCGGGCIGCSLSSSCADEAEGEEEKDKRNFSWYELTEKGRRLVGK